MIRRTTVALLVLAAAVAAQSFVDGTFTGPSGSRPGEDGPAFRIVNQFPNPQGGNYASGLAYNSGVLWCASAFSSVIHRCDDNTGTPLCSFTGPDSSMRG